jgi:hypothetical protein
MNIVPWAILGGIILIIVMIYIYISTKKTIKNLPNTEAGGRYGDDADISY